MPPPRLCVAASFRFDTHSHRVLLRTCTHSLSQPSSLRKLVEYITTEAPPNSDSKRKFKYPFLACEILCSEVWVICEAIYADPELLATLYGYLAQVRACHT